MVDFTLKYNLLHLFRFSATNLIDACDTILLFYFAGLTYREFEQWKKIGAGAFATVYKAVHNKDKKEYALKISHRKIEMERQLKEFTLEVEVLSKLDHKNIVRYQTSFMDDENYFCILMEFCGRDLAACLKGKDNIRNSIKPQVLNIFYDIICALEYLHGEDVVHRDVKPANVFVRCIENKYHIKLGDFGLACFHDDCLTTVTGSELYRAPEQYSEERYDNKVDMFPCGIILFELLMVDLYDSVENPHNEDSNDIKDLRDLLNLLKKLRRNTASILAKYAPFHPIGIEKVIHDLLDKNSSKRPSAKMVRLKIEKLLRGENSGRLQIQFLQFKLIQTRLGLRVA